MNVLHRMTQGRNLQKLHYDTKGWRVRKNCPLLARQVARFCCSYYRVLRCRTKRNTITVPSLFCIPAAPNLTDYPLPKIESIQGNTITLKCRASGRPSPLILWTKEDVQLTTGPRVKVTAIGDLHISSVRSSDQGIYRCHATNKAGSVVATTTVIVTGKEPMNKDTGK